MWDSTSGRRSSSSIVVAKLSISHLLSTKRMLTYPMPARSDTASAGQDKGCHGLVKKCLATVLRLVRHDDRAGGGEHTTDAVAHRDFRAGHLGRGGTAHLPNAFLQRVHAVHAGMHVAETAAIGVERQFAARSGVARA